MKRCKDLRRLVEVAALPALVAIAVVLPIPIVGALPDPLATHWGAGGSPNGATPRTAFWLGATGVWVCLWALLVWRSRRDPARSGARMPEAVPILAVGGLLAGTMIAIVAANAGEGGWRAADASLVALLGPIFLGFGLGTIAARWCERGRPCSAGAGSRGATAEGERPTVALGGAERAVWIGRARSTRLAVGGGVLGAGQVAIALRIGLPDGWIALAAGIATAVIFIWVAEVRVTVASAGVRVSLGPLRAPSRFVALEEIEKAEAIEVEPMQWGGWGYRRGGGYTGWIVRRGPGILIRLRDGRRLAVTVDGAPQASGLVNDLLARRI